MRANHRPAKIEGRRPRTAFLSFRERELRFGIPFHCANKAFLVCVVQMESIGTFPRYNIRSAGFALRSQQGDQAGTHHIEAHFLGRRACTRTGTKWVELQKKHTERYLVGHGQTYQTKNRGKHPTVNKRRQQRYREHVKQRNTYRWHSWLPGSTGEQRGVLSVALAQFAVVPPFAGTGPLICPV